jgi:hypothetical protein
MAGWLMHDCPEPDIEHWDVLLVSKYRGSKMEERESSGWNWRCIVCTAAVFVAMSTAQKCPCVNR